MSSLTLQERLDLLYDAQNVIAEAVDNIRQAVQDTGLEDRARAYIIPTLEMSLSDDHGWLGHQPCNIAEMIEHLKDSRLCLNCGEELHMGHCPYCDEDEDE